MELSKRVLRAINNMDSYVHFDLEKGIATVPLYYETPDDLIDKHLSRPGKPVVSDDAIDYLLDILKNIPKEFTVDFSLTIDDYGDYDHNQLLKAIRVTVENTYYYYDENRKKDIVLSVMFIIIGVLSMVIQYVGERYGWFGVKGAIGTDIIITLIELISWVFIWEGGAILFLTYENDDNEFHKGLRRFQGIRFVKESGEALVSADKDLMYSNWVYVERREYFARNFILFSYPIVIVATAIQIGEYGPLIANLKAWAIISAIVSCIIIVLLAIANISFYREKGPLRRMVMPLSLIMLCYEIISVIVWLNNEGKIQEISFYMDCLALILIVINVICLRYMQKQTIDMHQEGEQS